MSAIEQIQKTVLALPIEQRVFLVECLLESLPPLGNEMSDTEEMAEVERREQELESGAVQPLSEGDFWQRIEADLSLHLSRAS